MSRIQTILDFWLGPLNEHGKAAPEQAKLWWTKDPDFDQKIRTRFEQDYKSIVSKEVETWLETPHGRLAYIIVLDQFSRNMYRDTPKMYAADPQARAVTHQGLALGHDQQLQTDERVFLYMPLMHSESLEEQEQCVVLFDKLVQEAPSPTKESLRNNLRFAEKHRDFVARFGRFPHRNAILGRTSTPEEETFLQQPGSSF